MIFGGRFMDNCGDIWGHWRGNYFPKTWPEMQDSKRNASRASNLQELCTRSSLRWLREDK